MRNVPGAQLVMVALLATAIGCSDDADPDDDHAVLTTTAVEPAGVHCPDSGAAVHSGRDLDDDGVLDATEIETTAYVCRRETVALAPEPAGAHCPDGGTAIRSGEDLDSDGVLSDTEIRNVTYLCNQARALLTRVDADASDAPCRDGAALRVGYDLDEDGALDDSEVVATEFACSDAIVASPHIRTAEDVARLQNVRAVIGNLVIKNSELTEVSLPRLWSISGRVEIHGNPRLTAVHLAALYDVGGYLSLANNAVMRELDLSELHRVSGLFLSGSGALETLRLPLVDVLGDVRVRNNTHLTALSLPSAAVTGWLDVRDNSALTTLEVRSDTPVAQVWISDNQSLTSVHVRSPGVITEVAISDNPRLTTLMLPVFTVGGDLWIRNNPALATIGDSPGAVGGNFYLTGSPVATWAAQHRMTVAGNATITGTRLTEIQNVMLPRVGGVLSVEDNPALTRITTYGAGGLSIARNPELRDATVWYGGFNDSDDTEIIHARDLRISENRSLQRLSFWGLGSVRDDVYIQNNPQLVEHGLYSLSLARSITIRDNAALPTCRVLALFDGLRAGWETQSGNNDAGTCP